MSTSFLVDTDWIIDHLNGREETRQKLKELRSSGIAVSIISLAELYEGVYSSKDPAKSQKILDEFLTQFETTYVDEETCKIFGKQRGKLRRMGRTGIDFDLLIASTCLRWNLTLLTNNRKHFELVDGLKITSIF